MKLIIVESPNKTKTIRGYLGPGFEVAASFGHIRDLPKSRQGVDAPDFVAEYEISERSKEHVAKLKALVARASQVFLATDPDREGEAISWHLAEVLGVKTAKRITFQEVTKKAITDALDHPRGIDMNLVRAQEARRVLDRLVGWRVSPLVQRMVQGAKSAGRTQTPAVRLVVEREEQITGHSEVKHFGARVTFEGGWSANWDTKNWLKEGEEYVLVRALAERAAFCKDFEVTASACKPVSSAPPAPFSTSTLLQAASATLKLDPKRTQALAQSLFEAGLITYHRTDSLNLSAEAVDNIRALAPQKGWALPEKPRRWSSKENAQEAHEAIRPTHFEQEEGGEDENQRALYRLIWERAIACQLASAEYSETTTRLRAVDSLGGEFLFTARSRVMTSPGWRVLTAEDATNEIGADGAADIHDSGAVPVLRTGQRVFATDGTVVPKTTKPPRRFTKAALVAALEKAGIGRPSTYAALIDTILARGYVSEKKQDLYPTPVGVDLIACLKGRFRFADLDFTKGAETALDAIASGERPYIAVVTRMNDQLNTELEQVLAARGISLTAPSDAALKMATGLAEQLGVEVPADVLADRAKLSQWIDAHIGRANAAREERRAREPATEGQLRFLTDAIQKGKLAPPDGWPALSKPAASKAIDAIVGGSSKGEGKANARPPKNRRAPTKGTRRKAS